MIMTYSPRVDSPILVGSIKVDMMSYSNLRYPALLPYQKEIAFDNTAILLLFPHRYCVILWPESKETEKDNMEEVLVNKVAESGITYPEPGKFYS